MLSKENTIEVANWRYDENLWVRRISCVTFVTRIKYKDSKPNFTGFTELMFNICEENIKYSERFNQLGTGWLLRELSQINLEEFNKFFYKNFDKFSREAIRYAVEKLSLNKRKKYLAYRGMEFKAMINAAQTVTKKL